MEPNKYDSDFRNKLNKREIAPQEDSWSKLEAMLDASTEKKKKPMIWLYIAASVVGFLFVGNLFISQLNGTTDDIQVVNQENPAIMTPLELPQEISNNQQEIVEVESPQIIEKVQESRNSIAKVVSPSNSKSNKLIEEEVAVLVNPNIPQKMVRNVVSDDNIEKLLADASSSQNPHSAVKVSARNLLSQVDDEIELTFREKMIRKVSKNYQEIKVAVSNRNLESY